MKYYLVKQQDESDCGAACISTVAKFYGKRISVSKIRNVAGTDINGTSGKGIVRACESIGFSCKTMFSDKKLLKSEYPLPLIVHIKRDGLEHYIVIYKVKKTKFLWPILLIL